MEMNKEFVDFVEKNMKRSKEILAFIEYFDNLVNKFSKEFPEADINVDFECERCNEDDHQDEYTLYGSCDMETQFLGENAEYDTDQINFETDISIIISDKEFNIKVSKDFVIFDHFSYTADPETITEIIKDGLKDHHKFQELFESHRGEIVAKLSEFAVENVNFEE